ncbi:cytochrome P450 [Aspergillus heteromorphus CBS 117.55]|uniref:Cytochrome P450 n=1 Tax=Aspergillus heteromorphus CBS 117.55 TaxID=1448321 RepID=A0A317W823_9EURO|nr:cytochrome P450 [Aspergillus heteromorphus CBS 117.55]PWY81861.1 cytochrome P450 [Aspergillus heteromorphus CBS 117.55]
MFTHLILLFLLLLLPFLLFYLLDRSRHFRYQQYAAWPQLPPSLVWGHMKAMHEFISRGDAKRHIDIVFLEIRKYMGNPPLMFFDLRPLQQPLCVVGSHEIAEQISKSTKAFPYSMSKSPTMWQLAPLLGPHSILTAEGEQWKALRKRFNSGFAHHHLMTLLPCILDKAGRFVEILDGYARSGEEFALDEPCVSLTFDIIGAVTMDTDLRAQLGPEQQSEIVCLYRQLTSTYQRDAGNSIRWDFLNLGVKRERRALARRIDTLITDHIQAKFTEYKAQSDDKPARSILSLSLQDVEHLDAQVLQETCDQLKSFLFAGHDTTSIVLQWTFYELSRTPRVLDMLRRELDEIFGAGTSAAVVQEKLLAPGGGDILRQMSYTSAVIKEILRLYPPSGTARYMPPGKGFTVQLPDGSPLCLDGVIIYSCATLVHRDEAVYGPTKDEFVPERWLGDTDTGPGLMDEKRNGPDATGQIPVSAWRAFERGPRNCIGQELANIEARVILACTARRFDFEKMGQGALARDASGEPILNARGQYEVESELFNTMKVTAKPVDGTRMKVRLAATSG